MSKGLLTQREVEFVTRKWIGVTGGYLGHFTYRSHDEFYPDCCGIEDIEPYKMEGTTRERFERILVSQPPARQAIILRAVLKEYPKAFDGARQTEHLARLEQLISRCEGGAPVDVVAPATTRAVVEQALREVEDRVRAGAPLAAVDRVHTAFHGFLLAVIHDRKIAIPNDPDPSTTKLFKALRTNCPELKTAGPHADQFDKIANSLAVIVDALNPVRNRGTLAHANEHLIGAAEAMLFVNAVKTLMHYLNVKLQAPIAAPKPAEKPAAEFDDDIPF